MSGSQRWTPYSKVIEAQLIDYIMSLRNDGIAYATIKWVLNECVAAVERKKEDKKLNDHEASEVLTGIADMIEGQIEQINLSIYPISESVVINSRLTIAETNCIHAADALHLYVADKSNCDYFVTADDSLYNTITNSDLRRKLIPINISRASDMLRLLL